MTRNMLKEIDAHQTSKTIANLPIGDTSLGADKTEAFSIMNGTHTADDDATTGAVDSDDSDSNGGVSIIATRNDSSSVAANGGIASVDDAIVKAAEQEMSASAHSTSISAGASEPIPILNGRTHGA